MLPPLKSLKRNDNLDSDKTMTIFPSRPGIALLLSAAMAGACFGPALAGDGQRVGTPEADAERLVEDVLRKAGGDGEGSLGAWTREVIGRALERAGKTARPGEPAPLPAERHAGALAAPRPASADVLIFTSLSVPAASWRQWARDAARTGAPLVLRGVGTGGLRETARQIDVLLGGHKAGSLPRTRSGVAIDPRLFRLFGIERVPAVVVVPGGVPPCESRGCTNPGSGSGAGDSAPPHDVVSGNIGLIGALEAVAAEGDAGRATAKTHLQRLTGGGR